MAVVKELQLGDCKVIVHDDAIVKTQEEMDEIVENVKRIAQNAAIRTA